MGSLIRTIEKDDISQIRQLLNKVFNNENYKELTRLGGMTNRSYKVTKEDGTEYLVRLPGEGTEKIINRSEEKKSTELACRLEIDSELLHFGEDGTKIMRFIHNPQTMNEAVMRKKETIFNAARIFSKLHNCGEDTGVCFEVFEMATLYEKIIKENGVAIYPDYKSVKQTVMNIKESIDKMGFSPKVPCHNDSLVENWVLDSENKLYLIDWEYAGMNEAMWDLACLSIEANYNYENDKDLLFAYYDRDVTHEENRKFMAAKIYVDYLWTLWGLTRVPFNGVFMQEYADMRYARLKNNIDEYKGVYKE